jgi:hypothetical protein
MEGLNGGMGFCFCGVPLKEGAGERVPMAKYLFSTRAHYVDLKTVSPSLRAVTRPRDHGIPANPVNRLQLQYSECQESF